MKTTGEHLTAQDIKGIIDRGDDVMLLDVLSAEEFEREHIPGSEHVAFEPSGFVEHVMRLAGTKHRRIVVYCNGGGPDSASKRAVDALNAAGFTNVRRYAGGIDEWKRLGYLTGSGPANDIRPTHTTRQAAWVDNRGSRP